MEQIKNLKCLSASALKVIAMICMFCDHLWATVAPGFEETLWLHMVGRIAFPIFAFQIAEGFSRTFNARAYAKRLFWMAVITEIPFNLMTGGGLINPFHQNVLFTFWLSVLILGRLKKCRERDNLYYILNVVLFSVIGYVVGTLLFVDYYGYGILMVLLFYVCRNLPFGWVGQLVGMLYINWHMMGGLQVPIPVGGGEFMLPVQGLAVLALIPVWLYNGEKGRHYRVIQPLCYWFYPVHILILSLIAMFVLN